MQSSEQDFTAALPLLSPAEAESLLKNMQSVRRHIDTRIDSLELTHANRLDRLERSLESMTDEQRLLNRRLDALEREMLPRRVCRIEDAIGGAGS